LAARINFVVGAIDDAVHQIISFNTDGPATLKELNVLIFVNLNGASISSGTTQNFMQYDSGMFLARLGLTLLVLFWTSPAHSAILQVGPTRTYTTVGAAAAAAVNGDVIEIDASGTYADDTLAHFTADNLTIRGVGGRPVVSAPNADVLDKGMWVFNTTPGTLTTIENIEFTNCRDHPCSGIWLQGGDLTVRFCYFHEIDNGILAGKTIADNSKILIEYNEFYHNGDGSGSTHNLYIGLVDTLTFRYNYSHHTNVGHLLKSRAKINYILYNRLTDEDTTGIQGNGASHEIDLQDGGLAYIIGNLLQKAVGADNAIDIKYGGSQSESFPFWPVNELYVINNTCVNEYPHFGAAFVNVDAGWVPTTSLVRNNLVWSSGFNTLTTGGAVTADHNIFSATLGLVDQTGFNYHVAPESAAIGAGSSPGSGSGHVLTPSLQYVQPQSVQPRVNGSPLDAGAYSVGGFARGQWTQYIGASGPQTYVGAQWVSDGTVTDYAGRTLPVGKSNGAHWVDLGNRGSPEYEFIAWTSGALDTDKKQLYVGLATGDQGFPTNELNAFDFKVGQWNAEGRPIDPTVKLFREATVPWGAGTFLGSAGGPDALIDNLNTYPNGARLDSVGSRRLYANARQHYGGVVYMPSVKKLYFHCGVANWQSGIAQNIPFEFDIATRTWDAQTAETFTGGGSTNQCVMAWDSTHHRVVYVSGSSNDRMYAYDPAAAKGSRLSVIVSNMSGTIGWCANCSINAFLIWDPVRNRAVLLGGPKTLILFPYGVGTPIVAARSVSGDTGWTSPGAIVGALYDPVRDKYIAWSGTKTLYTINPDTLVSTVYTPSGGATPSYPGGINDGSPNVYNRFAYLPGDDLYVTINHSYDQGAFVFAPREVAGTSISGSQPQRNKDIQPSIFAP